jgi:subtilisin family serine protease
MGARGPFRIAAYFDDPAGRRLAVEAVRGLRPAEAQVFHGVAEGWVRRQDLRALVAAGLTVDVLAGVPGRRRRAAGGPAPPQPGARGRRTPRQRRQLERLRATVPPVPPPNRDVYRVHVGGPISRRQREAVQMQGAEITAFLPPNLYVMSIPGKRLPAVMAMPFVQAVERYDLDHTVTPELLDELAAGPGGDAVRAFDLVVHRPEDLDGVRRAIEATPGAAVVEASDIVMRFRAPATEAFLAGLAHMPEVASLAPVRPAKLYVDHGRRLLGIEAVNAGLTPERWTGEGEIVAIFDSGVDAAHPDLADRIASAEALAGASTDDLVGHGTHIAGIVAGTGAASKGTVRGVAPGARLAMTGVVGQDEQPALPADLGQLLQAAVDRGARVVNLSFGFAIGGAYDGSAMTIDRFLAQHPDVVVVVAAGNEGAEAAGNFTYRTVTTPGTAKNVVTVGASASDRGDFPGVTWGTFRPSAFSQAPAATEAVAGDPDLPAADSGRGPTDAGSVKPDVVAPGTFVLSARASKAPASSFWEESTKNGGRYAYLGGTSMAAPMVAGAAAVVRQFLRQELNLGDPSAALIKAVLVASARRLPSLRAAGTPFDVGYPDFDQGFGRVDLSSVLPNANASAARRIEAVDVLTIDPLALESRAPEDSPRVAARTYSTSVGAGATEPLRIVLTWTDREGEGVQNSLQLDMRGPGGLRVVGNALHTFDRDPVFDDPDLDGVIFDHRNTVQQVLVDPPPPGDYAIRVVAANTPFPPQGYALCVVGELAAPLTATA